ncbi:fatty acid CoA ligase family protein [Atopomonas hussainii]|uniref:fatty acid CoA ligase family protein n=1 Tax=Atopomonas hussainii TaxID=1429083 RepID=UPI0008FFE617|nr:fatty acid CoA ligase family protein [Atopomonas hussainii]
MSQANFCQAILANATRHPERLALRLTDPVSGQISEASYASLLSQAASWQQCLQRRGLVMGDRVLLASKVSIELYALLLALLGLGLVPVLLDRGMSRGRLLAAMRASKAQAVVGEHALIKRWYLLPSLWRMQRLCIDGAGFGLTDLRRDYQPASLAAFRCVALPSAESHGLISFTSGSTGAPKGADRTHHSLIAQHEAIRAHWPDQDSDIDAPCFPVLVLHNLSCGIRTVLPAIDLGAPGKADGAQVLAQFAQAGVTRIAAAPAFMQRLISAAQANGQTLPQVRSLVVGGSTVSRELLEACAAVFPNAHGRVVYGSTEAEPIAEIDMPELLTQWGQHSGYLVGRPVAQAQVVLVKPGSALTCEADVQAAQVTPGVTGEILVAGAHVLKRYVDNPAACAENKIPRADGLVWHRTGDCGFIDEQGQLWLTGRVKDAISTVAGELFTYPLEMQIDALQGVVRSALIQPSQQSPVLVLQGLPHNWAALQHILAQWPLPMLRWCQVESMPVDGRHNSKIDRPALRESLPQLTLQVLP